MMTPVERDFARRLHAAAIAKGKAQAALERLPTDIPAAFRLRALSEVALTGVAWLRVYFEIVEHFKAEQAQVDTHARRCDVKQAQPARVGSAVRDSECAQTKGQSHVR